MGHAFVVVSQSEIASCMHMYIFFTTAHNRLRARALFMLTLCFYVGLARAQVEAHCFGLSKLDTCSPQTAAAVSAAIYLATQTRRAHKHCTTA